MRKKQLIVFFILFMMMTMITDSYARSIIEDDWKKNIKIEQEQLDTVVDDNEKIERRFRLAVAYANLGQLESAMDEFRELTKLDGGRKTKDFVRKYEKIYIGDKNNLFTINYLAFAYYADEQLERSREFFYKIIELDPKNNWAYNYLGIVHHMLDDDEKALKVLKKSEKIEKNDYTNLLLSMAYYENGNKLKAVWYMSKAGGKALKLINMK